MELKPVTIRDLTGFAAPDVSTVKPIPMTQEIHDSIYVVLNIIDDYIDFSTLTDNQTTDMWNRLANFFVTYGNNR